MISEIMSPSDAIIRPFKTEDWPMIAEIYALGIHTGDATFETQVPNLESWIEKFHMHLFRIYETQEKIIGWAGLQPFSRRSIYAGVAEIAIYVHPDYHSNGIGRALINTLITESEKSDIWTLYASIFPENIASIKLHTNVGFRKVGFHERIAKLHGQWRSTEIYERRSLHVGK